MSLSIEATRRRYEFGRHETFAIREGWLSKGLDKLCLEEDFKADLEAADQLGLGSRMVKSLQYWLEATGLAVDVGNKRKELRPSNVARVLHSFDAHFEFPISWWTVHIMLARREGSVWNWFFNDFLDRVFDRATCVDAFERHVREKALNQTTHAVIHRDIACLLASYATPSANERPDPEDITVCPLRSLGLVVKHSDTGRFERTRPLDHVPIEAFLIASTLVARDMESDSVALADLLRRRNAPGRILGMDGDMIDEMATAAAETYGKLGVNIVMLGANRTLTLPDIEPGQWIRKHFSRILASR